MGRNLKSQISNLRAARIAPDPDHLTRRDFLAGAAAGALTLSRASLALAGDKPTTEPASRRIRSRVVETKCEHVVRGTEVNPIALREMLAAGLIGLTGMNNEAGAWSSLLAPADVIGLKFNRSGADALATTPPMLEVMVRSLVEAGWPADRLVAIEIPEPAYADLGLTRPRHDWLPDEVEIGEARDRLSGILEQVTAIVNVPFVKTHNLAGMTCCLKNLSHALVKHPAQFHDNGCAQIADILRLPQIRSKLRLHVVNALRMAVDGGPEAPIDAVRDRGSLLLGVDGVAVDTVSLEILNHVRTAEGLALLGGANQELPYLVAAARAGLGQADLHEIDWLKRSI